MALITEDEILKDKIVQDVITNIKNNLENHAFLIHEVSQTRDYKLMCELNYSDNWRLSNDVNIKMLVKNKIIMANNRDWYFQLQANTTPYTTSLGDIIEFRYEKTNKSDRHHYHTYINGVKID
jgi:hypothetical protein